MFYLYSNCSFKMKSLKQFFRDFLRNKGQHIFMALLIGKICAFLTSVFIIRLLPENEFGKISLVASVFAVFASSSGLGSYQSLLRFGSIGETADEKNAVSAYLLKKGFYYHLAVTLLFLLCSLFFVNKFEDIIILFLFFGVRLVGVFFQNHIHTWLRISGNNREFARSTNIINIFGLLSVLIFTYYFGIIGYLFAMAVTPFLSLLWLRRKMVVTGCFRFQRKELWNYAFHTAGTTLLSDALFAVDVVLLGFLMNENAVASYKVALLIPANLTFLALVFMQTDFPVLAKNFRDSAYLKNYIANYYRIFIPVTVVIFVLIYFFRLEILNLFFAEKYTDSSLIFVVLAGAFLLNILFRNLYGNMLSAVGRMKVNTLVSAVSVALAIILGLILVPRYSEVGMAVALGITMLTSGLLLMIYFFRYLRSLP